MARFNKLDVPYQWKDEFTKYPHGYTIFEALCSWTKQVDKMVDNINDWNDYLDNFVENFEFELQKEVQSTITRWQNEGLLDVIIERALNTKLDKVVTKLSDFPKLENEIDDTERLKRAVIHAQENGNDLVINENVIVSETIIINGIKVYGINNPLFSSKVPDSVGIQLSGEGTSLSGLEIDGNNITRLIISVDYNSRNIEIFNNHIHSAYSEVFGAYGIRVHDNSVNVDIHHNKIENIHSLEDGTIGNSLGSARGILLNGVKNGQVRYNEFDDIGGFEDGDSVHIQTTMQDASSIIEHNIFHFITKRGVKLQGPNNIVRYNKFYSNYAGEGDNTPFSAISDYNNNNEIYGNEIVLRRSFSGIVIYDAKNSKVYDNYIENDKPGDYPQARNSNLSAIVMRDVDGVEIHDNELVTGRIKIYSTSSNKNVSVKRNVFSEGLTYHIRLTNMTGFRLEDNIFKGSETHSPYDYIRFDNPTNFVIGGNEFNWGYNIIRFYGVMDDVIIYHNTFKNHQSHNRYRTTDVTEGEDTLKIFNDYTTGKASIPAGETSVGVVHGLGRKATMLTITPTLPNTPNFYVTLGENSFSIRFDEPTDALKSFLWKAE